MKKRKRGRPPVPFHVRAALVELERLSRAAWVVSPTTASAEKIAGEAVGAAVYRAFGVRPAVVTVELHLPNGDVREVASTIVAGLRRWLPCPRARRVRQRILSDDRYAFALRIAEWPRAVPLIVASTTARSAKARYEGLREAAHLLGMYSGKGDWADFRRRLNQLAR